MILDGRNRALICQELGLALITEVWEGPGSPLDFVVRKNLHRRHLTESERAMVAAKLKSMFEAEARQRMLAGRALDPQANLPGGQARDLAAQLVKVSSRSVEAGSKVLRDGVLELQAAVEAGQVRVSAAAEVAALPPAEQVAVVTQGQKAVQTKAKQLRQKKRRSPAGGANAAKPTATPGTPAGQTRTPDDRRPAAQQPAAPTNPSAWTSEIADAELNRASQFLQSLTSLVSDTSAQKAVRALDRRRREEHRAVFQGICVAMEKIITLLGDDAT
jgi:hypothetical protein